MQTSDCSEVSFLMAKLKPLLLWGVRDVPQTRAPHLLKYSERHLGKSSLPLPAGKRLKVLRWQKSGLSGRTYGRAAGISSRQSNINIYITAACRWWSNSSARAGERPARQELLWE